MFLRINDGGGGGRPGGSGSGALAHYPRRVGVRDDARCDDINCNLEHRPRAARRFLQDLHTATIMRPGRFSRPTGFSAHVFIKLH